MSCRELPRAVRSCRDLPGAARNCQELPGAARSCQELPGAARSCLELSGVARLVGWARCSCLPSQQDLRQHGQVVVLGWFPGC